MMGGKITTLQKLAIGAIIVAFLALIFVDFFLLPSMDELQTQKQELQTDRSTTKISEIRGPRIDDQAASICRADEKDACVSGAAPKCDTLPPAIWIFLLVIYVGVLIFNLTFTFAGRQNIQWFWEALLTVFFLAEWFYFDLCRAHLWFPLYVLKLGIIIYAIYLYYLQKKWADESETAVK